MILMISSLGDTFESPPNTRFGRTETYIKYNLEENSWEALSNPASTQRGGAGVAAAQFLANQNAAIAISGRFGPNAYQALNAAGIQMFTFDHSCKSIKEVIEAYKNNSLEKV